MPKKAQEAKNLLDLGRGPSPESSVTQLTPGLTPKEVELLREPSRHFGRYVVLDEIGRGGMGVVYRAWDSRLRRVVALKMAAQTHECGTTHTMGEGAPLSHRLVRVDAGLMTRLQREAQTASRLAHPNLIRVLDAGVCDGIFYFTMDLLSGVCLADMSMPMPEKDALRLMLKVARGVAHAHKQGVLHRDIKPSNILVSDRGEPVLIDFGLAKDFAAPAATVTGDVFGTPCYMAPEQARGDPRKIGHRTDVYGLGATLYHLVTGKPPYADLEPAQVLLAVLTHPPYPASTLNPMISPRVDDILRAAMARAPEDRYPDADAFADDIEEILGLRTDVDPTGRTIVLPEVQRDLSTKTSPLPPRAVVAWAWVFGIAAALLVGVGVAVWRSDVQPPAPPMRPAAAPPGDVPPPASDSTPPSDPPAPSVPPMGPPRVVPPASASFDATAQMPPTPLPLPSVVNPPVDPPADPPIAPADPAPDPDEAQPPRARELLRDAHEAFDRALAMPLTEKAFEVREILGGVVYLCDQATGIAATWAKPKRLRGDALLALGLYPDAVKAYKEYVSLAATRVRPAESLLAEFLEWFRSARPWAEEPTPTAQKQGEALAVRLEEACAAKDLEVSPFLPWRPAAPIDAVAGTEGARADLHAMAAMARFDWGRARERVRSAATTSGVAGYVAEAMGWVAANGTRPDAILVEMADRRVRCPEPWLVASFGLAWDGDFEAAERAVVRALEARDASTPEVTHQLGLIAYRKEDYERAKNEWAAAQGADPTRRAYLLDLGAACLLRGEFVQADACLKAAIAKDLSADPPTNQMRSFAEYAIACCDARRIHEVEPRPKKRHRDALYRDAVSRVKACLFAADKLPLSKDRTATQAPRTYWEWSENNVRHWIRVDPWAEGLRADAGTWKQIEAMIR